MLNVINICFLSKMGNYFSLSKSYFLCVICGNPFLREISGTLLCKDCSINNQFDKEYPDQKQEILSQYMMYPLYFTLKEKKTMFRFEDNFEPLFYQKINARIKELANHPNLAPRYRLIKSIIKYLDISNTLNKSHFKGIYLHSMKTNDILFVHHPEIKDQDRIIYIDFDLLVQKLIDSQNH
jgi:hypothetical protein